MHTNLDKLLVASKNTNYKFSNRQSPHRIPIRLPSHHNSRNYAITISTGNADSQTMVFLSIRLHLSQLWSMIQAGGRLICAPITHTSIILFSQWRSSAYWLVGFEDKTSLLEVLKGFSNTWWNMQPPLLNTFLFLIG